VKHRDFEVQATGLVHCREEANMSRCALLLNILNDGLDPNIATGQLRCSIVSVSLKWTWIDRCTVTRWSNKCQRHNICLGNYGCTQQGWPFTRTGTCPMANQVWARCLWLEGASLIGATRTITRRCRIETTKPSFMLHSNFI
jgi:hypothetical protein